MNKGTMNRHGDMFRVVASSYKEARSVANDFAGLSWHLSSIFYVGGNYKLRSYIFRPVMR